MYMSFTPCASVNANALRRGEGTPRGRFSPRLNPMPDARSEAYHPPGASLPPVGEAVGDGPVARGALAVAEPGVGEGAISVVVRQAWVVGDRPRDGDAIHEIVIGGIDVREGYLA